MSNTAPHRLTDAEKDEIRDFLELKSRLDRLVPAKNYNEGAIFDENGQRKYMDKWMQTYSTLTVSQGTIYNPVSGATRRRERMFFQSSSYFTTPWVRCPDKNTKEIYHPETGRIETIHYPYLPVPTPNLSSRTAHALGINKEKWLMDDQQRRYRQGF
ncbi:hypothetical protein JCM3765_003792 [Sporobolomyces pararoseus]